LDVISPVLVRYHDAGGNTRVGSGFLVNDRAVLTANHVATGAGHTVVLDGDKMAVERLVLSETDTVDLAVLVLAKPVRGVGAWRCARVARGLGGVISGCWAVGYPRGSMDQSVRVSLQVDGYIRPADGMRTDGKADSAPLTLIGKAHWTGATSDAESDWASAGAGGNAASPWAGMSGAAVVKDNMIIGVVISHLPGDGEGDGEEETLTLTPLSALRLLPTDRQAEFRVALGLGSFADLPVLFPDSGPRPGQVGRTGASPVALSDVVRVRYTDCLIGSGLPVPNQWDEESLSALRHAHHKHDATADLLEALCLAITAKPVLAGLDGRSIGIRKLQFLYKRHVGDWPCCATLDEMMVLAAAATISERRRGAAEPGYASEKVTALARFLLGIAGLRAAPLLASDGRAFRDPAPPTLNDPGLRDLADWLTGPLSQQREDAEHYLATRAAGRIWVLIELDIAESAGRSRPDGVVITLIPELGEYERYRVPCAAPAGTPPMKVARQALRDAVTDMITTLPGKDVLIDLSLTRSWLDVGMEHWDVVPAGRRHEPLSRHYSPRLRWAMHLNDPQQRASLEKRTKMIDWAAAPEAIPESVTSCRDDLDAWLDDKDQEGTLLPPYFSGVGSRHRSHDPLESLLSRGYGFLIWLTRQAAEAACDHPVHVSTLAGHLSAVERKDRLPTIVASRLRTHKPLIIWSDPEGRAGFPLPPARGAGTRRGGGT
jgi:Trypsin-like peptidase domain